MGALHAGAPVRSVAETEGRQEDLFYGCARHSRRQFDRTLFNALKLLINPKLLDLMYENAYRGNYAPYVIDGGSTVAWELGRSDSKLWHLIKGNIIESLGSDWIVPFFDYMPEEQAIEQLDEIWYVPRPEKYSILSFADRVLQYQIYMLHKAWNSVAEGLSRAKLVKIMLTISSSTPGYPGAIEKLFQFVNTVGWSLTVTHSVINQTFANQKQLFHIIWDLLTMGYN